MGEPSPKQIAFLEKNGRTVPATSAAASIMISEIYKEKGFAEKPRPAGGYNNRSAYQNRNDYSNQPPTEKMIAALKKSDWYTAGMSGKDARARLDILANNNWRKPENVAGPDTVASDLEY